MKFLLKSGSQTFDVRTGKDTLNTAPSAILLAGGRSVLVGNAVVRISRTVRNDGPHLKRVTLDGVQRRFAWERVLPVQPKTKQTTASGGNVKSPMSGKIVAIHIKPDDVVRVGDLLMTIEAMKMENRIVSELSGIAAAVQVVPGQSVATGDLLLSIKALV